MSKSKYPHTSYTIRRTVVIEHGTMRFGTGEITMTGSRVETKECGTPLFAEHERLRGVCRSCHEGWQVDGNKFADEAEKERAMTAR